MRYINSLPLPLNGIKCGDQRIRENSWDYTGSGQLKNVYAKSAALRRIRRFVSTEDMISLYNSFVLPDLEYCSPLLLGVGNVQASRLGDANFYILRSILGYGKNISYHELLGIVNMKTLERRRICSSLLFLCKSLFCNGPRYICNVFRFKDSNYNLRGSGVNLSMPQVLTLTR